MPANTGTSEDLAENRTFTANGKNADKTFKEKVDGYQDSNFKTARSVYKRYHENPDSFDINVRAEKMAEVIYKFIKAKETALLSLLDK